MKIFCLSLLVWLSPSYAGNAPADSPNLASLELGKQIYRKGKLPNGQPLHAVGAGNAPIIGTQTTCISCHRRSGLGASEGVNRAPPIIGEILFQARTLAYRELGGTRLSGKGARPAYTEESLLAAINEGKDVTGRNLDPLMPRYAFSKADAKLLIQYLNSLSMSGAAGISDTTIHFATVFTPDTLPAHKTTVEKILQAFFRDYNAETRNEKGRAKNAPWHKTRQYTSYRQLDLRTWNLEGPAETWNSQLKKLYGQQPVFAVINGIGHAYWQPIHDYCETNEIPCLFPTTDLAGQSAEHYYSMYFSEGVNLEARAIAAHLGAESEPPKTILQLYRRNAKGQAAAASLSQQSVNNRKINVIDLALDNNPALDNASLREKVREKISHYKADAVVLWLDTADMKNISDELGSNAQIQFIFVSSTYTRSPENLLPPTALAKTYLLSRFVPENNLDAHLRRFTTWAKPRDIDLADERVAANAYFAAMIVTSATRSLRAYLTRDYLIERIEHMLERAVFHSVFPEFTLGPGQRFASKGSYIIGPLKPADTKSTPPAQWIIP
ncbi:MAG TPA: ABC transporter substrate-binding protein [Gammaproteobacteria bacterium]